MDIPTLAENLAQGAYRYEVICQNGKCKRGALVLGETFPQHWTVIDLRRWLYCSSCGERKVEVFPRWEAPVTKGGLRVSLSRKQSRV
ncbi:MAG: hypothetical protein WA989_13930 [Henriciella sp.]